VQLNIDYEAKSVMHQAEVKANLSLCLSEHYAMKISRGVKVELHAFLTPSIDLESDQLHALVALSPKKVSPSTHRK
jgi:hypothetical protein